MSKVLFAAVKELVDEKKYEEARIILKAIPDPKARDWETALDELDPPPAATFFTRVPISAEEKSANLTILIVFIIIIILIFMALLLFHL
jgi:hypothetical protein